MMNHALIIRLPVGNQTPSITLLFTTSSRNNSQKILLIGLINEVNQSVTLSQEGRKFCLE